MVVASVGTSSRATLCGSQGSLVVAGVTPAAWLVTRYAACQGFTDQRQLAASTQGRRQAGTGHTEKASRSNRRAGPLSYAIVDVDERRGPQRSEDTRRLAGRSPALD